jgi:hypothetical protein
MTKNQKILRVMIVDALREVSVISIVDVIQVNVKEDESDASVSKEHVNPRSVLVFHSEWNAILRLETFFSFSINETIFSSSIAKSVLDAGKDAVRTTNTCILNKR